MANEIIIIIAACLGAGISALLPYIRKKTSKKEDFNEKFAVRYVVSAVIAFIAGIVITGALSITDPVVSAIVAFLLGIGGKDAINEIMKWGTEWGILPDTTTP